MFYISEYTVSRHFGGPEEGGWWYDIREFVKCWDAVTDEEDAYRIARQCNSASKQAEREDPYHYDRGQSIGGDDCEWSVERHPMEDDNTREPRPHYE